MLPESDVNLLEAYLDDALSPTDVQRVDSRLSDELLFTAAFNALRSERAARVNVFQSAAPADAEAEEFADRLMSSIRRQEWKSRLLRYGRACGVVAACLAVGFTIGWVERGHRGLLQPAVAQSNPPVVAPAHGHSDSHLAIHPPKAAEQGQYQVAILDADGNVVALQKFAKMEDARQFADDLGQFELRRQQVQESQAMVVTDRF